MTPAEDVYGLDWLRSLCTTAGKGALKNVDARAVLRCVNELVARAEAAEAESARLREALIGIRDYPKEDQPRRTSDGYPQEMAYDEYAYRRIIDSYRAVARSALK